MVEAGIAKISDCGVTTPGGGTPIRGASTPASRFWCSWSWRSGSEPGSAGGRWFRLRWSSSGRCSIRGCSLCRGRWTAGRRGRFGL